MIHWQTGAWKTNCILNRWLQPGWCQWRPRPPFPPCSRADGGGTDVEPCHWMGGRQVYDIANKTCSISPIFSRYVLESHNLTPISLEAKEGLALINGTQLITSIGHLSNCQSRQVTSEPTTRSGGLRESRADCQAGWRRCCAHSWSAQGHQQVQNLVWCQVDIYTGWFFSLVPPKKLKYGKPRLGQSMLT